MKRLTLVLFSLMALMVQSCDEWPPGNGGGGNGGGGKKTVVGDWSWISSEGGIFPMIYTPENQGFSATLSLTDDKAFKFQQSDGLGDFGAYVLGKYQNQETIRLETASARPTKLYSPALPVDDNFISFRGSDTVMFSGTGADMLTYTYVRIK